MRFLSILLVMLVAPVCAYGQKITVDPNAPGAGSATGAERDARQLGEIVSEIGDRPEPCQPRR